MLLLSCPVRWCGSCLTHPIAVLASTAVMSCTVLCQVCGVGVGVGVCLWCSCGGVSSVCSPLVVVEGGAVVDGGVRVVVVGGMVMEGRLCCCPPRLVLCPPLVYVGVPLLFVRWPR